MLSKERSTEGLCTKWLADWGMAYRSVREPEEKICCSRGLCRLRNRKESGYLTYLMEL